MKENNKQSASKIKLISFVIPAYNEEKVLRECLDSVMEQAGKSVYATEVIVVNNASSDRTREIASSFSDVVVVDEPKKGLVNARLAGFLASRGDLIANIDADTKLTPGWLEEVIRRFEKDPRLVALSGPLIYHDLGLHHRVLVKIFYCFVFLTYIFTRFVLRISSMLQGGNFVVRRWALEAIGGYDNARFDFYGEDADLARRLHTVGPVKFTFSLPIYSSGRRLAKEGIVIVGIRYSLNYFSTIFLRKPITKRHSDLGR